jgi:hypothetical protein
MEKAKISGIMFGLAGLALIFYAIAGEYYHLSHWIGYDEPWQTLVSIDALMFWVTSFVFAILGLTFYNEKKSPYLMGISTIASIIAWVFYSTLVISWSFSGVLFIIISTLALLGSTITLASVNVWKKQK